MSDDVQKAEQVIKDLINPGNGEANKGNGKKNISQTLISSSQLRKIFSAVNNLKSKIVVEQIKNKPNNQKISEDLQKEIQFLKAMFMYQAGRNSEQNKNKKPVYNFVKRAELIERIEGIGDSLKEFNNFHKYLEALVAFHKYYSNAEDKSDAKENSGHATSVKSQNYNHVNGTKDYKKRGGKYNGK